MKQNIIGLLMLSTVIVSCGDEMKKSSLDELNNQKSTLVAKIDSLNKELKSIENEISKLDTQKRLQVVRISINCSSFTRESKKELSLINFAEEEKMEKLTKEVQILREKYGLDSLKWGGEL